MLAVAGGGQNTECLRALYRAKAILTTIDPVGNNLLHIAARNKNHPALEFLLENWPNSEPLDLSDRNKKGETVYSIATELDDKKALEILKRYESRYGA